MKKNRDKYQFFTRKLLEWYELNQRSFPWKNIKDPYKIWLSEIILQQTRTNQGLPYYLKISEKYPDIYRLASVEDDEFMKDWQGLGYYSRARNLLFTARWIVNENKGEFPLDYKGLLKLKGVGEYTAAAISSFAYHQAHAVVDGNVIRVIARYFGIEDAVDISSTKKQIKEMATQLLDHTKPSIYNQAIMDFGATQCTPKTVDCLNCVMNELCSSYEYSLVDLIPIKSKKIIRKHRYFHFIILQNTMKEYLIQRRTDSDIWKGLYQFPMVELEDSELDLISIISTFHTKYQISVDNLQHFHSSKQHLTHQTIHGNFYICDEITNLPKLNLLIGCEDISTMALPKMLSAYVNKFII